MYRRTILASLALALMMSFAVAEDPNRSAAPGAQSDAQSTDAAAAQRDPAADTTAATDDAAAQPAAARDTAEASPKDPAQAFIMEAYSGNLFEIQAGQWVAQKAQDDQTKQFARMLVQDHQKANQQLKQIAQSANIPVQEKLGAVHQAKLQKMQQCSASELSRKFIFGQVAGHTMNVLEYGYQAQNAQNDQVKQYASQALPKLQQHLQQATDLATQQMGGAEARPAGERLRGDTDTGAQQPRQGASDRTTGEGAGTGTGTGASDQPDTAGQPDRSGQSGASERPQSE
jgi:putative membrane protein